MTERREQPYRLDKLFGVADISKIIAEDEAAIRLVYEGKVKEIVTPHSRIRVWME